MKIDKLLAGWILFLLLAFSPARAQFYSREALKADVDTMYRTLQDVHPDLFAVAGRERLDSMVDAIHARIAAVDSVEFGTFYKSLIPLFEAIGDGHTRLPVASSPDPNTPVFPFEVAIPNDSTLIVKRSLLPDNPIPAGTRIDSINGRSVREIIRTTVALNPGERMHFRLAYMAPEFYRYYRVLYGDTTFRIRAVQPDGTAYRAAFSGIPYRIMAQSMAAVENREPFSLHILSDTVAVFEFRSMSGKYRDRFRTFLDSTFRLLRDRKIPNLIIDLRENGGGNSFLGDMLKHYISHKPFTQFGTTRIKHSAQLVKAQMDNYKQHYPQDYSEEMILADMNCRAPFGTIETYRTPKKNLKKPLPKRDRYRGKVWMLTSHYTFSSAADLSWAFQYFKMGTVVGEETGGLAVSFGDMITLRMPNTRLPFMVSFKKFYNYGATDDDVHGTLPDYEVPADEALDYTLELIRHGK